MMKSRVSRLCVFALCAMASVVLSAVQRCSSSVPPGWTEDFEAAKKAAAAGGKYILLAFSGSDWCPWCVRMDKDVYSVKSFVEGAGKKFELVMVDMPQDESILSPLAKAQNRKLLAKYGVRGFPCSVLVHPTGEEVTRFPGYQRGGPEAFLSQLTAAAEKAGKPKKPVERKK